MLTGRSLTIYRGEGSPWQGGVCLLLGGGLLGRGVSPWKGGGIPACTEQTPPPVNRMTDRCKNITLVTTSFGPVTKIPVLPPKKDRIKKRCPVLTITLQQLMGFLDFLVLRTKVGKQMFSIRVGRKLCVQNQGLTVMVLKYSTTSSLRSSNWAAISLLQS